MGANDICTLSIGACDRLWLPRRSQCRRRAEVNQCASGPLFGLADGTSLTLRHYEIMIVMAAFGDLMPIKWRRCFRRHDERLDEWLQGAGRSASPLFD